MALIFMDGFDKYGPIGTTNGTAISNRMSAGEWSTTTVAVINGIVAGLSSTGSALSQSGAGVLLKYFTANYPRFIGGLRFNSNLLNQIIPMQARDLNTAQWSICVEVTGAVNLRSGTSSGTVIATSSTGLVSPNTTHYVEWDVTVGTAGAYQVWLDGSSLFSGTGNTRGGTTNNYANTIANAGVGGSTTYILDDLYLFDATGTTNNAVLLNSPRIETNFPTSDSAVQFAVGAGILGYDTTLNGIISGGVANNLFLHPYVPAVSCTLVSIGTMFAAVSTASVRGVIYADSSGAAGTLMSAGPTIIGTNGTDRVVLPLTTPQSLSAGVRYWLGYMIDTTVNVWQQDSNSAGYRQAATFTSGAPSTAPAMLSGQTTLLIWGNLTGTASNWYEVSQRPPADMRSYVYDTVVNHEDLYGFGPLSVLPANIYAVAVKGYFARSDSGARSVSLRMKSGAIDSGGSSPGQFVSPSTFNWYTSLFVGDPATTSSTTWNPSDLNVVTLSGGNLTATGGSTSSGIRSISNIGNGKYYWECTATVFGGGNSGIGIANSSAVLSTMGAVPTNACLVYPSGNIYYNNVIVSGTTLGSITAGSIVCIALDMINLRLWFRKSAAGSWNATAGTTNNPATNVGGINISSVFGVASPAFAACAPTGGSDVTTANFGASAFAGAVPIGFTGMFPDTTGGPWTGVALNAATTGFRIDS